MKYLVFCIYTFLIFVLLSAVNLYQISVQSQGNTSYKQGKFASAVDIFQDIDTANANIDFVRLHNLGNSLYFLGEEQEAQKNWPQAIESYKQALKIQEDAETRSNLEYVEKKLAEQEGKQENNQEKQDENQQESGKSGQEESKDTDDAKKEEGQEQQDGEAGKQEEKDGATQENETKKAQEEEVSEKQEEKMLSEYQQKQLKEYTKVLQKAELQDREFFNQQQEQSSFETFEWENDRYNMQGKKDW